MILVSLWENSKQARLSGVAETVVSHPASLLYVTMCRHRGSKISSIVRITQELCATQSLIRSDPLTSSAPSTGLVQHQKMAAEDVPIKVEFTGGLEAFFSRRRNHAIRIPHDMTIGSLLPYLVDKHMTDPRPEFFVQDGSVYVR